LEAPAVFKAPRGDLAHSLRRFGSVLVAVPALFGTTGIALVALAALLGLAVLLIVVYPAVWSRDEVRRKAALEVLKRIVRHD
jgi:VIT1/CCC1 family predicted Fe2+/Mn2+ transporter